MSHNAILGRSQKSAALRLLVASFVLLLFVGCAGGGDPAVGNGDAGGGDADVFDGDDVSDAGDSEPDVVEDPCPVCCPGERRCANNSTAEVCNDQGTAFLATSCTGNEACVDGRCELEQVCTPGERQCYSSIHLQVCRPDGGGYVTETCPSDTVCFGSECVSGQRNGHACEEAADCAGGHCRCGTDEICPSSRVSYCTSDCSANPCTSDQICWKAGQNVSASYDHCLRACDQSCSLEGRTCTEVLTMDDGTPTWKGGCLGPELRAVGRRCDNDAQCVNGNCDDELFGFNVCTHRCEVDGCPSGTACVRFGSAPVFWCSPLCDNSRCMLYDTDWQQTGNCVNAFLQTGGTARVCKAP